MKISKIEAVNQNVLPSKLKVAAYCRVSTASNAQHESLEAQKTHYESWIKKNPEWEFAGIYFDSGITGTKADCRDGLQAMLHDCRKGKISHILTKSISRFSRNTSDCLSLVRELLDIGVTIYFEKENIDTGSMESELLLSVLSSLAENESHSISENEKWAIRNRFLNGTFKIVYPPYGYRCDENGDMIIQPEEAETVKFIFDSLLSGMGTGKIAKELQKQNIPTKRGKKWCSATILGIIKNEKYTGDALFQKTYTDQHFHRHENHGEADSFLAPNHHEAIIGREKFEKANALIEQRASEKHNHKGNEKAQNRYVFSGKIICGSILKRRIHNRGSEIAWCCKTHIENIALCDMKYIRDNAIKAAFVTMLNKLIFGSRQVLRPYLEHFVHENSDENIRRIQELQELLNQNAEKRDILRKLRSQEIMDSVVFNREVNFLKKQSDAYRIEIASLKEEDSGETVVSEIRKLLRFTGREPVQEEFSEELFTEFVDKIIVYDRHLIGFQLKCGLTLKEKLE